MVLASGNPGKLREFSLLLAPADFTIEAQSRFGVLPPAETGDSFVANALIKARHAAAVTGLPALADDSGLEVDALGGAPGVHSTRYAGEPSNADANIDKLLTALANTADDRRGARFHCVIAFVRGADDPAPLLASGHWQGRILRARRGTGGFGYDPVFEDPATGLSAAELHGERKNTLSHRGIALRALLAQLRLANF